MIVLLMNYNRNSGVRLLNQLQHNIYLYKNYGEMDLHSIVVFLRIKIITYEWNYSFDCNVTYIFTEIAVKLRYSV